MGVLMEDLSKEWKALQAEADTHDAMRVRALIAEKYGFLPTEAYCRDLIAFINTFADMLEEASYVEGE